MKSSSAVSQTTKHPNILLIVMDAARAKNLSCYGYHRPTSSNLERFAEQCVVYETAISPGGWSLPGHASMFTGLYSSKHGAHEQHKYLSPEIPTMAEILRSYGYRTLAFCYNGYVGPATGLDRGFDEFNGVYDRLPRPLRRVVRKARNGMATLLQTRDSGARYINKQIFRALGQTRNEEQPFFMFVHYGEPHAPYHPPQKYNRYLPDGVSAKQALQVNQDQWKFFADPSSMDDRDFEILTALYDGEITYLDTRLAELIRWLDESGTLDSTMVIITADHGENIGDHQMLGHQYCLYDTLLHVPLIIRYPNATVVPGRVTHQVQTLDLLPTVLNLLGDDTSETYRSLQGGNLLSSDGREFSIAEWERPDLAVFHRRFPGVDVSRYDRALKMIRTDGHKYIWSSNGSHELYDIRNDPDETQNIIAECPEIARNLDRRLTEWRDSFEVATPLAEAPEFDETVKERLRALGYLE